MAHPDIELLNTIYPAVPAVDLPKSGGGLARFVDADDYLPLSGGTITGDLDVDGDVSFSGNATIAEKAAWRNELGLGTISTEDSSSFLKREPASTTELPQSTNTSGSYPIVLSDSFTNDGVISYMTKADFRNLLGISEKPTQLYNSTTGSNETITLSSSAANYNHMRIYYKHSSDVVYCSVDVFSPDGKKVMLPIIETTSTTAWIVGRRVLISGTSISTSDNWYGEQNVTNRNSAYNHVNLINIIRVEGWND